MSSILGILFGKDPKRVSTVETAKENVVNMASFHSMATTPQDKWHFAAPDGHSAIAKPVARLGGPHEGKWLCRIKGPRVLGISGVKTVYCAPSQTAAKQKIASFLRISPSDVHETTSSGDYSPVLVSPPRERSKKSIIGVRRELRESLRRVRLNLSREKNLPAYYIFNDVTLDALVTQCPMTEEELLTVTGIGQVKLQQYGRAILQVIQQDRQNSLGAFTKSPFNRNEPKQVQHAGNPNQYHGRERKVNLTCRQHRELLFELGLLPSNT
eukprot:scaffold2209_cov168-Amphora_coffeaeformis.AAC.1